MFVCAACILHAYRFVCIPMSFKSRNHVEIQCKLKICFYGKMLGFFEWCTFFPCKLSPICWKWRLNASRVSVNSFIHFYRKSNNTIRKNMKVGSRRNISILHLACIYMGFLLLKSMVINIYVHTYKPVCIYECRTNNIM